MIQVVGDVPLANMLLSNLQMGVMASHDHVEDSNKKKLSMFSVSQEQEPQFILSPENHYEALDADGNNNTMHPT